MRLCLALLAIGSMAFAANYESTELEDQQLLSGTKGQRRVITPSGANRVREGADAYLTADFLYWQAAQDNMSYAMVANSASTSGTAALPQGKTYQPDFSFDPGFKVGLGAGVGHDAWDVYIQYTWFHENFHKTSVTRNDNSTQLLQVNPSMGYTAGSPLTYADGEWRMRLSVLDGELGRDSFFSPYFTVRPFVGVKAAWQAQDFNVNYTWSDSSNGNVLTYNKIPQNLKVFSIGLRTGANTVYSFNRNWSIYGNFAANVLNSRFKANSKNNMWTDGTEVTLSDNIEAKTTVIQPVLEFAMGLGWDVWFQDDAYHLGLRAGWEQQWWFRNNYFIAPVTPGNLGDLSIQGFTLKVRFDF